MKGRFARMWLAWLVLLPATALGDGGFFPASAFERVQVPDQRALIHFADGTETLVIDTAFRGDGTNFAWIIPVPSVPVVEPATTGLFTTLQILFQPRIVHDVLPFYRPVIFFGLVLAYVLWKLHRGESPVAALLFVALFSCLYGLMLPALGRGSASSAAGGVDVVDRKRVGVYETATLSSNDGEAVFDWLEQNGYVTPTNFIPAIRAYAREGWYFVASRIRLDAALPQGAKPHPLALKFKTERPVYPLRLTGINSESCRIELYVFGPSRAELPSFTAERCARPIYPPPDAPASRTLQAVRIRHPLLRSLVEGSPAATRLVGHLSSRQMREDGYLAWTPSQEKRLTLYSRHGAAVYAANIAVPVLMIGLLALMASRWSREDEPVAGALAGKVSGGIILAALMGWATLYLWLPKTDVVISRSPTGRMTSLHGYLVPRALEQLSAGLRLEKPGGPVPGADWVRRQLAETSDIRKGLEVGFQTNVWTGEPWREEDSPGNYIIRETDAGIDYVWHDLEGGENVVPLFREAGAQPP